MLNYNYTKGKEMKTILLTACCNALMGTANDVLVCRKCWKHNPKMIEVLKNDEKSKDDPNPLVGDLNRFQGFQRPFPVG